MVDSSLVAIMVCPESHQSLTVAEDATVQKVNAAIAASALKNRDGEAVSEPIEAGLIRQDGAYLYPVRDGIPVMLIGEAIPLGDL